MRDVDKRHVVYNGEFLDCKTIDSNLDSHGFIPKGII